MTLEELESHYCKYCEDGHCTCMNREDELKKELKELEEELNLARSDIQSLKNMIVKMCYDRYGE